MLTARAVLVCSTLFLACACGSSSSDGSGAAGAGGGAAGGAGGTAGSAGTAGSGGAGGTAGGAGGAAGAGNPIVDVETNVGTMSFELDPVRMPNTTANFLAYVDSGFYAGTIFHRVIPDFMIQGGGYEPGLVKKPTNPPIKLETSPDILHDYGVISMARTTDPDSATCQFFVVNNKNGAHSLDGQYAAFGHIISGSDVLDAISQVPTHSVNLFGDVPVTDVVIVSAKRR